MNDYATCYLGEFSWLHADHCYSSEKGRNCLQDNKGHHLDAIDTLLPKFAALVSCKMRQVIPVAALLLQYQRPILEQKLLGVGRIL
jgi:hypothetical protein